MMKIVVFLTVPRKESSSIILKQMKIVMNNNRNREVKLILANPLKISKKGKMRKRKINIFNSKKKMMTRSLNN